MGAALQTAGFLSLQEFSQVIAAGFLGMFIGAVTTLIISALLSKGVLAAFIFMAAAMLGVALLVGVFGPRTNAVVLEELSR